MSVYQFDKAKLTDCEFELGILDHLVIGNHGRLLDPRRTPVKIIDIQTSTGMFVIQVQAFEDKGVIWKIPFEDIHCYQFAKEEKRVTTDILSEVQQAIKRFDRPLKITCEQQKRNETLNHLQELYIEVSAWLDDNSQFFFNGSRLPDLESRKGDDMLCRDLQALMAKRNLLNMEEAFAKQFVSNPYSGELVKGHRIVLAELGLAAYDGKIIRDHEVFNGDWSRERRTNHILYRQAFTHSVFRRLGHDRIPLYRGMSFQGDLQPHRNQTFVSATFSHAVANSHFESANKNSTGILYRQLVPIERLFMTYYETEQMNCQFLEAEAVLLYDENNTLF
ncbi:hypothetical protein K8T06_17640 [bacterium]|nr:hypothetical protein [bacterium]